MIAEDNIDDAVIEEPNLNNKLTAANLYKPYSDTTSIPVDTALADSYHEFFQGQTFNSPIKPETFLPKQSFAESFKQGFKKVNDLTMLYDYQKSNFGGDSPLDDPVPADWNAFDELQQLENIDSQYAPYLLASTGPKDFNRRKYQVYDSMYNNQLYEKGSMWGHASGMIIGGTLSPTTWIPLGIEAKSARLSVRLAQDLPRIVPGVATSSALHEAIAQTTEIQGNLEDFATNSFRDTIFGTAFMGTLMGLGHGYTAGKIWNTRRIVNITHDDIEVVPVIKQDGSFSHLSVRPMNENVSAAKLDLAQQFANSSMAKEGLFAIPFLGDFISKSASKLNPILRMMTSPSEVMRAFIDRAADHGIVTEGNIKGIPSPEKFEVKMAALNGDNKQFMWWLKGLHLERNGIDPNKRIRGALTETKMRIKGEANYVTPEAFMTEIEEAIITGKPSKHSAVNEAADAITIKQDNAYKEYRQAMGLPEEWLPPRTSKGYLSRAYDLDYMLINEEKWVQVVGDYMKKSDQLIQSHMEPIELLQRTYNEAAAAHLDFIKTPKITAEQIKASSDKVQGLKKQLKTAKETLQDKLRNDEDLRIHVDDVGALSASEAKQLKSILKPLNKVKKEIKLKKAELAQVNFEKLKLTDKALKSKSSENAKQRSAELAVHEEKIAKLQKEVEELQNKHDQEYIKLQDDVRDGKISPIFYEKSKSGVEKIKFKKTSDRLKFRKLHGDNDQIRDTALAYYHTIMNQTAEQTNSQVLSTLLGRNGANPLKQRSLLIPDHVLYKAGFLTKNLGEAVANYTNLLGRRTHMKNIYKDVSYDGGIQGIVEQLRIEYLNDKNILDVKLSKARQDKNTKEIAKLEKAIRKREKQFRSDKEDMSLTHNKMMGNPVGTKRARDFTAFLRNFTVSLKLGAVPLTMVTDLMAIPMKHGLWPTIRDGLMPTLKNIKNLITQGKGEHYVVNAPHAHLGLNHTLTAHQNRIAGGSAQSYTPMTGKLQNGMETLAHVSQNIAGTNQVENFFQEITASTVQSKIMRYMHDYLKGSLKPKDKEKLLVYGLDPEKWAQKFVDNWKAAGSDGNGFGGYQSRFWEWGDKEAANLMAESVMRGTRDTVIRRGMFDAPFALDDPFIGTMFMFKGWVMASMTRYTVPLMQRPDSEKLIGAMLMLSAGALVTPLRRIAKGEDPIQEDDNMFLNALIDGGVLSLPMDIIETMNVLSGGAIMKDIKNDRFVNRSIAGLLAGPVAGIGDDIAHVIRMAASGHANQADLNRAARLIPLLQSWQLRGFSNKMVESTGLPKTEREANRNS